MAWERYERRIDERVTRFLCATVHLDGSFANHAWFVLLFPGRQGQAPEKEIDPVAVARHTMLSLERRVRRDRRLALLLLAIVVAAVLLFFAGAEGQERMGRVVLSVIALPFVGWLVALFIVYSHYRDVRRSAIDIHHHPGRPARESAARLPERVELRLEDVHESNVVIYNSYTPFVGTGHTLDTWKLTLYAPPDGDALTPPSASPTIAITPEEVHRYLYHDVPGKFGQRVIGGRRLHRVIAERRLYVDGGTATQAVLKDKQLDGTDDIVERVVPINTDIRSGRRAAARVSDAMLDEYTRNPNRTARTYVCFTDTSGNGDVVVTVLGRAEMGGRTVYVEGRSQVLLPVQPGFKDVYWVSQNADQAVLPVLRAAVPATTGLWLESPLRLFKYWWGSRQDARTIKLEGQRIQRGQPVNYGASSSLREDAMLPADPGYYGAADEVMQFRSITQQILNSLYCYLREHRAPLDDFEEQRQLIVEQTFNVDGIRNEAPKGTANLAL